MDYDSLNLHEMTVFDLCDDEKILREVFAFVPWWPYKERHLKTVAEMPSARWDAMLILAEHTEDKALEAAVEKQFAEDMKKVFNQ